MSILFSRLKSLRTGRKKLTVDKRLNPSGNIYTLRRFVFSPIGAILIFGVILLFGLMSYYSLLFLKNHIDQKKRDVILQTPSPLAVRINEDISDPQDASTPEEPYLPPEPGQDILDPIEKKIVVKATPGKLFVPRTIPLTETPIENALPAISEKPSELVSDALPLSDAFESSVSKAVPEKKITAPPEKIISPETQEEIQQNKDRKLQQARMAKTSQIAALTRDIETAILHKDFKTADALIDRLSGLKNSNSLYFLKLRAVMDISNGQYESAARLLQKVIDTHPEDLEAGMNMAVVEIKMNQPAQARQRLLRLREAHPSDSRIDHLLSRL